MHEIRTPLTFPKIALGHNQGTIIQRQISVWIEIKKINLPWKFSTLFLVAPSTALEDIEGVTGSSKSSFATRASISWSFLWRILSGSDGEIKTPRKRHYLLLTKSYNTNQVIYLLYQLSNLLNSQGNQSSNEEDPHRHT